jgi:DNA helicase-2/ATP-dependent DNA helicase PcrA
VRSSGIERPFVADLHVHSKYSRACSRDLDLETFSSWARRKGLDLLGTGDFTHPAWNDHLRQHLVPAEPGLFRLAPDVEREVSGTLPPRLAGGVEARPTRFALTVEIATIRKQDGKTRKVHHVVLLPDFDAVDRFTTVLARMGKNLGADGRPILGITPHDLLEITLESSEAAILVPAHIWTPWFGALGSKSGFDSIADCYGDLTSHIVAVETGLSSDPAMNWRVSGLDAFRLISNSDAHSAPFLGREATAFDCDLSYFAVRDALGTGDGLHGTIEFFPEEGKYHADGHRACGVCWDPGRTREAGGRCPECGRPLTIGVLHRVTELADRAEGYRPASAPAVTYLIQLTEILGEIHAVGPKSKKVRQIYDLLLATLGPELEILTTVPPAEIDRAGGPALTEAITRLRAGRVRRTPGFDGEFGVIRLFDDDELRNGPAADSLFDLALPAPVPSRRRRSLSTPPSQAAPATGLREASRPAAPPSAEGGEDDGEGTREPCPALLAGLDAPQRAAAAAPAGPLLIVAGPGAGKTRTLTHRIAYLCTQRGVAPRECLAITFTRRAAEELRERLEGLLGPAAEQIMIGTFHALGLRLLRENPGAAGLTGGFRVAEDAERQAAASAAGLPGPVSESRAPASGTARGAVTDPGAKARYTACLRAENLVDLDELVTVPVTLLTRFPELRDRYRARWPWLFVDEYQDVDATQYALLRLLCPEGGNLCAIGDPDQAIYSFRGADVEYFLRFADDFGVSRHSHRVVHLHRNYRSSAPIVLAATQAIAPSTLVPGRRLEPARVDLEAAPVTRYAASSVADEADFIARTIDDLLGGLSHRSFDAGRADPYRAAGTATSFCDVAVLYRTDTQAAPIVDALTRAGIPVQKRSHDRLADRAGVASIAHELRLAATARTAPAGAVVELLRGAARTVVERYERPALDPLATADAVPAAQPGDVHTAVEVLTPLAARCGDDVERFLGELSTGAEVDAWDPRADRVTLLTLHAAKGLEFPVVFLAGCEDGLLPLRWGGGPTDPAEAEAAFAEERRLFFVGMTRARRRLFLSHVRHRGQGGTGRDVKPSPFLAAIDRTLCQFLGDDRPRRARDQQLRLL